MACDWVCYVTIGDVICELTLSRTLWKSGVHMRLSGEHWFIADSTSPNSSAKEDSANLGSVVQGMPE